MTARPPTYLTSRGVAAGLAVLVVALVLAALSIGTPMLAPHRAIGAIWDSTGSIAHITVTEVRAPRIALTLVVGAALAICGLLLQDVLRNDLAGPELLGTASGSALAMALVTLSAAPIPWAAYPLVALAGAAFGGLLVFGAVGRRASTQSTAVIGASVSALLSAMLIAAIGIGGGTGRLNLLLTYLLGTVANRTWDYLVWPLVPFALLLLVLLLLARRVEIVRLGDAVAQGLGVRPSRVRAWTMIATAIVVAGVTAACGPIAFIALLAPHLMRRLLHESRTTVLLLPVALAGIVLLQVADLLARTLAYPIELPVGVTTTAIGVPCLLWMLMRRTDRVAA